MPGKITAAFLGCLLLQLPLLAVSDPLARVVTARPLALGGAFNALADDASTIFFNPAGLCLLERTALTSTFAQPSTDITLTALGGGFPDFAGGSIGLGYRNLTTANITLSSETFSYNEGDISVSYCRKILPNLSLGGNFRFLYRALSKDIPSFKGLNGSGLWLDTGLLCQINPWLRGGLSLRNLGAQINYQGGNRETVQLNVTGGLAGKLWGKNSWSGLTDRGELVLSGDLNKGAEEPLPQLHLGIEWHPLPLFALRVGLEQTSKNTQANYNNFTFGFGFVYSGVAFDYAYKKWEAGPVNASHYFSLGYVGYNPPPAASQAAEVIEPMVFSDVADDHWARQPIEMLTARGLIDYYPDGTFRPERPISRAELVSLLVRNKNYPLPLTRRQVFSDVSLDFWAADSIQVAQEQRLALGYPDGTFRPRNSTTRAEGVTFISRFDGLELKNVSLLPFPDVNKTHWAIREILAAKEEGLLEYLSGKDFSGNSELSRGELAELLYRTNFAKKRLSSKEE